MRDIKYWVDQLGLLPHPEGGFYKEVYRSDDQINVNGVAFHQNQLRSVSTSIYFLLPGTTFSGFHRIKSDEVWHFYSGAPVSIYVIGHSGKLTELVLGNNPAAGEALQHVVPAGVWFASKCKDKASYCLCGCTVAPGFDFEDFELGEAQKLCDAFPEHESIIRSLSRK